MIGADLLLAAIVIARGYAAPILRGAQPQEPAALRRHAAFVRRGHAGPLTERALAVLDAVGGLRTVLVARSLALARPSGAPAVFDAQRRLPAIVPRRGNALSVHGAARAMARAIERRHAVRPRRGDAPAIACRALAPFPARPGLPAVLVPASGTCVPHLATHAETHAIAGLMAIVVVSHHAAGRSFGAPPVVAASVGVAAGGHARPRRPFRLGFAGTGEIGGPFAARDAQHEAKGGEEAGDTVTHEAHRKRPRPE